MASIPVLVGKRGSDPPSTTNAADELRARVGGISPFSLKPDTESRHDQFERLRKFYVLYTDGTIVREGLGEITDWVARFGEDAFDEKVKAKYRGFTLASMTRPEIQTKLTFDPSQDIKPKPSIRNLRTLMSFPKSIRNFSFNFRKPSLKFQEENVEVEPEPTAILSQRTIIRDEGTIRKQLLAFYREYEPKMVSDEKFNNILNYAMTRGIEQLNVKLMKRYGAQLELEDDDNLSQLEDIKPIRHKRKSISTMFKATERRSKRDILSAARSMVSVPVGSMSYMGMRSIPPVGTKEINLPPQMKLFLKLYYAVYDPMYIVEDKLEQVHQYAASHGLDTFNTSLKTKYKESLSDFQARVEIIQDELHSFFLKKDISNANENLLGIVQWTMRNGRRYTNRELSRRYGADLDNYREARSGRTTIIEPLGEPTF